MSVKPDRIYSARGAQEATGLPRGLIEEALASGDLAAVRRGRRWVISGYAIRRFLEHLGAPP